MLYATFTVGVNVGVFVNYITAVFTKLPDAFCRRHEYSSETFPYSGLEGFSGIAPVIDIEWPGGVVSVSVLK